MKRAQKNEGNLKNIMKSSLQSSYFLNNKFLVPQYFKMLIVIQKNLFFLFFSYYFERGKRKWLDSNYIKTSLLTLILVLTGFI